MIARYTVELQRRDRCLSGSSPLESAEKIRGMELQRDEMEEKEKKEREEEVELAVEQKQ
jgi:hypothetical protein